MLRCKVGDLAIIIQSPFTENLGAIVEVREGPFRDLVAPYWRCVSTGRLIKFEWLDTGKVAFDNKACIFDGQLRPIRPAAEDKEVTDKLFHSDPTKIGLCVSLAKHLRKNTVT